MNTGSEGESLAAERQNGKRGDGERTEPEPRRSRFRAAPTEEAIVLDGVDGACADPAGLQAHLTALQGKMYH